jgi:hypothetical protein
MISPYHSIISYPKDDWEEYFDRIAMIAIFKPVIDEFKSDRVKLRCVIQYILQCYSVESDKIKIGADWNKNKLEIFEDTCQPLESLRDATVYLKSSGVIDTVNNWLRYQDEEIFCEMAMLKDLKLELQMSAISPIHKSSGEIDYDQKYKNAGYVNELRKNIKDLESEFIQNNNKLKDSIKDFKSVTKKKNTLSAANAFEQ